MSNKPEGLKCPDCGAMNIVDVENSYLKVYRCTGCVVLLEVDYGPVEDDYAPFILVRVQSNIVLAEQTSNGPWHGINYGR